MDLDTEASCGHTKIKWITWTTENHTTSGKFMCLDCNTDFIPVTLPLRRALYSMDIDLNA